MILKQIKSKLKNQNGMSFTELLATLLILLMVTSIVAGGIPAAIRAYKKVVDTANAQILMSTTTNALRNELGHANKIETSGTTINYSKNGLVYKISQGDDGIKIEIKNPYQDLSTEYLLVSEAVSKNQGLNVSYESVTATEDTVVFQNIIVKKDEHELAKLPEYVVLGGDKSA